MLSFSEQSQQVAIKALDRRTRPLPRHNDEFATVLMPSLVWTPAKSACITNRASEQANKRQFIIIKNLFSN